MLSQGGKRGDVRPVRVLVPAASVDGLLKTDFKTALGKSVLPRPLPFARSDMGQKTAKRCSSYRGTTLNTVERCSGHDGTWGVKSEYSRTP